ncbi:glycine receptor subunit alpha-4-like isoform X1 [Dreissena polymorpha]|uniref:glycine receptor subunit alpha-4-like isoform X1 n=1 Tax=Dreissena polymorpha TaxID=45954 RepID=UPI002263F975|nr:glycine receptor subunit alpha-4-like isoform X1 [Dreissena polymorpha]
MMFHFCWILFFIKVVLSTWTRQNLTEHLLDSANYNPSFRPTINEETPTTIKLYLILYHIYDISETYLEFTVDAFVHMLWNDTRLEYASRGANYSSLELGHLNIKRVWTPDIYFINSKKGYMHTVSSPNRLMHIFPSGKVKYSVRLTVRLACPMNLTYFPFDTQSCPIIIQSYGFTDGKIQLMWADDRPFKVSVLNTDMPHFLLDQDFECTRNTTHEHGDETESYDTLTMYFTIERKIGFYIVQVFLPDILFVLTSYVSFYVDPNAVPARVTLGVTCVLAMTTQTSSVRQFLPQVSYVKAMDIWDTVCLVFVFSALLEFGYVNNLLRHQDEDEKRTNNETFTEPSGDDDHADRRSNTPLVPDNIDSGNGANDDVARQQTRIHRDVACDRHLIDGCLKTAHICSNKKHKAHLVDVACRFAFPLLFLVFVFVFVPVCIRSRASRDSLTI